MKNNIIENEVFKFRISFQKFKNINVYVKPFPDLIDTGLTYDELENEWEQREDLIKEKYFTKEKIDELKKEFIKMIEDSDNPFYIYCYDTDAGYNITEEQLFKID
jgi:hypothetical protein